MLITIGNSVLACMLRRPHTYMYMYRLGVRVVRMHVLFPTFNMESSRDHPQRLRLVDINQSTVKQTWPLLLDAVQRAHFISVDLVSI